MTPEATIAALYWQAGEAWIEFTETCERVRASDPYRAVILMDHASKQHDRWFNLSIAAGELWEALREEPAPPSPSLTERARAQLAAMTPDQKRAFWDRLCAAADEAKREYETHGKVCLT